MSICRGPMAMSGVVVLLWSLACAEAESPPAPTPSPTPSPTLSPAPSPSPKPEESCTPKQTECRGQQLWKCGQQGWKLVDDCGAKGHFCLSGGEEGPPPFFNGTCSPIAVACPFVDVETDEGWVTVGEILRNLNRPALYGSQSLTLPASAVRDGQLVVRLAERKAEVTHLDALWVEVAGRKLLPEGCQGLECAIDGRWLDLREGEERSWVFSIPRGGDVTLWAHGYYTPLSR